MMLAPGILPVCSWKVLVAGLAGGCLDSGMCHLVVPAGMRGVVLSFGSEQQALMSIDFLRKAAPLEHNAPVKKSQVGRTGWHSG